MRTMAEQYYPDGSTCSGPNRLFNMRRPKMRPKKALSRHQVKVIHICLYANNLKDLVSYFKRTHTGHTSEHGIELQFGFNSSFHDRRIETDKNWVITLGRGLDIYQRPDTWISIGANELELRACNETNLVFSHKE